VKACFEIKFRPRVTGTAPALSLVMDMSSLHRRRKWHT
jgi:hypothetical protein